jgi:hypothetical protein
MKIKVKKAIEITKEEDLQRKAELKELEERAGIIGRQSSKIILLIVQRTVEETRKGISGEKLVTALSEILVQLRGSETEVGLKAKIEVMDVVERLIATIMVEKIIKNVIGGRVTGDIKIYSEELSKSAEEIFRTRIQEIRKRAINDMRETMRNRAIITLQEAVKTLKILAPEVLQSGVANIKTKTDKVQVSESKKSLQEIMMGEKGTVH